MKPLSESSILVFGNGYEAEIAAALSLEVKNLYYYTPWQKAQPEYRTFAHGHGMDKVVKVLHPFDYIDKVDLIVFLDLGWGDLAAFLRAKGYTVFGAGKGERLEEKRYDFRKIQQKLGLPTQTTKQVKGVTGLREHLTNSPKQYVKLDVFRGDIESFYAPDYDSVEMIVDEIETAFGPLKDSYDFLCESPIDTDMETGIDTFYSAPFGWVHPTMWGVEWRKNAYLGTFQEDILPEWHKNTMKRLAPVMKGLDYRGPFSTEEKVTGKDKSCIIDITARLPFTFSSAYPDWILNLSDILLGVAQGRQVRIKPAGKFVGCLPLETTHLENKWVKLNFPSALREKGEKNGRIRLSMATKVDGKYYAVPGMPVAFNLVAWGDSVEQVTETIEKLADEVDAFGLDKSSVGNLECIMDLKKDLGWE